MLGRPDHVFAGRANEVSRSAKGARWSTRHGCSSPRRGSGGRRVHGGSCYALGVMSWCSRWCSCSILVVAMAGLRCSGPDKQPDVPAPACPAPSSFLGSHASLACAAGFVGMTCPGVYAPCPTTMTDCTCGTSGPVTGSTVWVCSDHSCPCTGTSCPQGDAPADASSDDSGS